MFIKRGYDVVETNRMAAEDVGSLVDGHRVAATDLENGRLVVRDGDAYKYTEGGETEGVYLVTTPERLLIDGGLNEFYNPEGRKVRVFALRENDRFSTTAIEGEPEVGSTLVPGKDGKFVAGEEGLKFEVVGRRYLAGKMGYTVEFKG